MWGSPDVVRHIGGVPFTPEQVWQRMLRYAGLWALLGYGYWAIEEKAGRARFVGDVGFADFHRAGIDAPLDAPEAGWVLMPWARGQGFATEAVGAAHAWLAEQGCDRVVCIIEPGNTPSIRVAERVGYAHERRARYHDAEVEVYSRALG